jgi:hypothetical protein
VPLRVCNCGQNLWKKQILTAGFDRGGTTFPCPLYTGGSSGHGAAIRPDTDGGPVLFCLATKRGLHIPVHVSRASQILGPCHRKSVRSCSVWLFLPSPLGRSCLWPGCTNALRKIKRLKSCRLSPFSAEAFAARSSLEFSVAVDELIHRTLRRSRERGRTGNLP